MNLNYAYHDINHDGEEEIIFADTSSNPGNYQIYSIWTTKGGSVQCLAASEYRSPIEITKDGLIKRSYSGGWQTDTSVFYEITGAYLRKVAGVSHDGDDYYPNDNFEGLPSKEEYLAIIDQYDKGILSGLKWTKIQVKKGSKYAITKFKVGSKNYSKKFKKLKDKKKGTVRGKSFTVRNKRLIIKTGEGWKIKRIWMEYADGQGVSSKKLKNNKKFSAKKHFSIDVTLVNKYTHAKVTRYLDCY